MGADPPKFDKAAYQREYMRQRRVKAREAKMSAGQSSSPGDSETPREEIGQTPIAVLPDKMEAPEARPSPESVGQRENDSTLEKIKPAATPRFQPARVGRWTEGPDCPKCGWTMLAGRCSNRYCR